MIFTLEALQAKHGDALLLHYGAEVPKLAIIDGGPAGVYKQSLAPRLAQIRAAQLRLGLLQGDDSLPVDLLMVSHIDDDHINGVLQLTDALIEQQQDREPLSVDVATLWHNSFDDMTEGLDAAALSAVVGAASAGLGGRRAVAGNLPLTQSAALMAASVAQGQRLRANAQRLQWAVNRPFGKFVARLRGAPRKVELAPNLSFIVLAPSRERLDALKTDWMAKAQAASTPAELQLMAAEFLDKSVYNLSSIVVMAEVGKLRMLLTGDARGDDILTSLGSAGFLKNGVIKVDLLKVPHHGSDRNVSTDFFRQVQADCYVISADGKHGNPDLATLKMISEARGKADYTLYLTNKVPGVHTFLTKDSARDKYQVVYRKSKAPGMKIELGEEVPY